MRTTKTSFTTWRMARKDGRRLYAWRRSIGLNRETFARLANFSERSLATYEKRHAIPAEVQPQINEAVRLIQSLLEIIPAGELRTWLQSPNPGFGGRKPWALIQKGERDLVWRMIHQTRQGAYL